MNKYNRSLIKTAFAGMLSVLAFTSCSEDTLDRINNNNNNPLDVPAKFIITDLQVSTAFEVVGGDFSLYSSVYIEHETGTHNQVRNAEVRNGEPTSSTTLNNTWGSAYSNIKKAKLIIKKCSEGGLEVGSDVTLGIAKLYLAYNAAVLTDLFGDIPYFESGILNEAGLPVYRQPKVDKQEVVYQDIMKQLDEAIVLFDGADAGVLGGVGSQDLIYGGNKSNWKKVAYGLKARYTMRLLEKSSDKSEDLKNILAFVDKSFTSASEEFKFDKYDGSAQKTPLGSFSDSRAALAGSKSYANKLAERNDPRLSQIYFSAEEWDNVTDPSVLSFPDNGSPDEIQLGYDFAITDFVLSAPTQMLSFHELLYLKAEAYARLNDVKAENTLKEAIKVGFANLQRSASGSYPARYFGGGVNLGVDVDLSEVVATEYYDNSVKVLYDANPLKEIMIQKYLAFMGANGESVEAYADYRRLQGAGENFIQLANPKNVDKFPLRFVYGNSDVLANPNVGALIGDGTYVYKENVWWAGGTR